MCCKCPLLTLAIRGGVPPPQTVFPELLENGGAQRRQILAILLCIQGGPTDIKKFSGQVMSLTYDVILKPLHGRNAINAAFFANNC